MIHHNTFPKLLLLLIAIVAGFQSAFSQEKINENQYSSSQSILPEVAIAQAQIAQTELTQSNLVQAAIKEKSLRDAKTVSDSMKILLDVYTLSDKINRDRVRMQLINLAQKSNNDEMIGNVIKELSTSTDDTRELERLIELSENLPKDTAMDNFQTAMIMEKANADAASVADSAMERQMMESMKQDMEFPLGGTDPYKEIQNIYRTMVYLGASSQGPLYFEYIKRLEDLVDRLPEEDHAIKNLYFTTAAIFYTRKRDYKRAIYFDRRLIKELDAIKEHYQKAGKDASDLDYYYFVSNRRMLRNYRGLTPEEIEQVYQNCIDLAKTNERAAEEFHSYGLTNSYYYMATGQYAKAIPELKKALSQPDISDFRKTELLGHLGYAYRLTGNKEGELETVRNYAQMLLKDRVQFREDMYKEIELRNSINRVLADQNLAQERQRHENQVMRKTSLTLVYVLAVILIFMCQAYFRVRRKLKLLESQNKKLHNNFEAIFDTGAPKGTTSLKLK